jgi:hypothetical protein
MAMRMPEHLENVHVDSDELERVAANMNAAGRKMRDGKPFRADAGETALLARQIEYVRAKTTDKVYAASKALLFIPIATDVPSGAQTFVTVQWDMAGSAKIISNFADDLPKVTVLAAERANMVHYIGNAYDYSVREMRNAAFAGVPLSTKKADAARIIHERTIDDLAATGDSDANLPGFINNTNVPFVTPVNGDWDNPATTSAQILEDLYAMEWAIVITSKELFEPDTMLLAPSLYKIVATKSYSDQNADTVLTVFLRNAKFIKTVDQWHKLENADAESNGPRAVIYKKDPMVVEIVLPDPFTQEPAQWRNLVATINCTSTIGGVVVNYPLGIAYCDGLLD